MAVSDSNSMTYRFEDFVLDPNTRVLSRGGEVISLTPRVLDTLLAFVERPGETLTKDELMSAIWADSFVEESNLTQNVAVLRKTLGEDARAHRYIVTVPGRGYKFVPEVTRDGVVTAKVNGAAVIADGAIASRGEIGQKRRSPWLIPAVTAIILVAGAVAAYFYFAPRDAPSPTVA